MWDSPNSAGVVIDAIRCCKLALDRGLRGTIVAPSAYFMKSPPRQIHDDKAREGVEAYIRGEDNETLVGTENLTKAQLRKLASVAPAPVKAWAKAAVRGERRTPRSRGPASAARAGSTNPLEDVVTGYATASWVVARVRVARRLGDR